MLHNMPEGHDYLAVQALAQIMTLVCFCIVQVRPVQFHTVWFGSS